MIRISHTEFGLVQASAAGWWREKQSVRRAGRLLGYAQAVKLAVYRFHKLQGDQAAALAHFDQLVTGRLTNAKKVAEARLQLQAYIDWCGTSGVIVADHRARLNLLLRNDVTFGGEVARVDIDGHRYRAVLLGPKVPRQWRQETRMPLIQVAVAEKYQRDERAVSVAVQLLDGGGLEECTYGEDEVRRALNAAKTLAERVSRLSKRRSS